ncbi:hypothetical protein BGZ63DRAFT_426268 [Mariannaea sp. PMI_226]|nr:hypothetical protein BGZ63DRAFT_426268 [Mariannaea sp. PMI_226]
MAIPQIHLLCMDEQFAQAFNEASHYYGLPQSVPIQIHDCALSQLPSSVQFDTIVSPANSYGRLDETALPAVARFCPARNLHLVHIPDDFRERSRNVWGTRRVALCPTMRLPEDVRWDREVVYECIWSLLCAIDNHNREVSDGRAAEGEDEIRAILMTPLATGVGRVTPARWAAQAVLAMKHFFEASNNQRKWSSLEWEEVEGYCNEVQSTWDDGHT